MEQETAMLHATWMEHLQTCGLHEHTRRPNCYGSRRRGGTCRNKAIWDTTPGLLPTCKIHQFQLKRSDFCKARVACGFSCSELLAWEPHGFQLCPRHRKELSACYFLAVPIEIRCRIYRLLLPDTVIPPRFRTTRSLTSHRGLVYTAILRLSHQIHEEATSLLYSTNEFAISVSEDGVSMCNKQYSRLQHVRYRWPILSSLADSSTVCRAKLTAREGHSR